MLAGRSAQAPFPRATGSLWGWGGRERDDINHIHKERQKASLKGALKETDCSLNLGDWEGKSLGIGKGFIEVDKGETWALFLVTLQARMILSFYKLGSQGSGQSRSLAPESVLELGTRSGSVRLHTNCCSRGSHCPYLRRWCHVSGSVFLGTSGQVITF